MNIPDEAVEAAAKDLAVVAWGQWEYVPNELRSRFLRDARICLQAATPYLAAQTLREASDAYPLETAYGGAEHAVTWLKQRADNVGAVPEGAAFLMGEGES